MDTALISVTPIGSNLKLAKQLENSTVAELGLPADLNGLYWFTASQEAALQPQHPSFDLPGEKDGEQKEKQKSRMTVLLLGCWGCPTTYCSWEQAQHPL